MNEKNSERVESFALDHTKVKAPFVRKCTVLKGEKGDVVTKYDIRFMQPNCEEMQSEGIHTLEHLLATYLREYADNIIDLSPMGCRTGFYLTVWGDVDENEIVRIVTESLSDVLKSEDIPAENPIQCGNYKLHSLSLAKEYAKKVLDAGLSTKVYGE